MNVNKKERPSNELNIIAKRANENSRASVQHETLSDAPNLLESVLPEALDAVSGFTVESKKADTHEEKSCDAETNSEVIVFHSEDKVKDILLEKDVIGYTDKKTPIETVEAKTPIFTKFSDMSVVRKILTVICVVFCLWSLLPAIPGIIGIGMFAPLIIGLFALFTVAAWDFISSVKSKLWKALWAVIAAVVMIGVIAFAFVSGHMISASNNTIPANNNNVTVVVLGCKVNGSEPSRMLQGRLDTAAEYLLTHPDVNCIVAGGAGNDEDLPEAVVMKQYLVDKGVAASRIKIDDKSTSTKENLINALEVANANNYYTTFYIVTDRFHQFRAGLICKELGITAYALSCETPWYLTMNYWFREMFAVAYHSVTKN